MYRFATAILFLMLLLPAVGLIAHWGVSNGREEHRVPAPSVTLASIMRGTFFTDVDLYLKDHLGFRSWFVLAWHYSLLTFFNTVPALFHAQVTQGFSGRLYYRGREQYLPHDELTPAQKENLLKVFKYRAQAFHPVPYVLAVVPVADTIYLPDHAEPAPSLLAYPSSYQQMLPDLMSQDNFRVIDLVTPVAKKARELEMTATSSLYYRYDHHWNNQGDLFVYQTLLEGLSRIDSCVRSPAEKSVKLIDEGVVSDVADLLGLGTVLFDHASSYSLDAQARASCPHTRIAIIADSMFVHNIVRMLKEQGFTVLLIDLQGKTEVPLASVVEKVRDFQPTMVIDEMTEEIFTNFALEYKNESSSTVDFIR